MNIRDLCVCSQIACNFLLIKYSYKWPCFMVKVTENFVKVITLKHMSQGICHKPTSAAHVVVQ